MEELLETIKKYKGLERVNLENSRYLQKIEDSLNELYGHWEFESKEVFKPSFADDAVLMVGPYDNDTTAKRLLISFTIGTVVKTLPLEELYIQWKHEVIDDHLPKFLKELDDHLNGVIIQVEKKHKD